MRALAAYILSLTAAALISSIVLGMLREGIGKQIVKLLCGCFMLFTAVDPLLSLRLPEVELWTQGITADAESAAAAGTAILESQMRESIRHAAEAYICSQAERIGFQVRVDVAVAGVSPPEFSGVQLYSRDAKPEDMQQLQVIITQELGITPEEQTWIWVD